VWQDYGKDFESTMAQVQQTEVAQGLDLDEIPQEKEKTSSFSFLKKKKEEVSKHRRNERDDKTSNLLYNMKSAPVKKFK